jgi:AAA family ATP:ADP antiporter
LPRAQAQRKAFRARSGRQVLRVGRVHAGAALALLVLRMVRLIERIFGTSIRPGERRLVAVLAIDLFVLLTVYYILKVVREPLILLEGGVVGRNAARGAQALVLLFAVPAYSALANRLPARKLVTGVIAGFIITLLVFPLLGRLGVPFGFLLFVWIGIFSITVVAQFWSLANDLFDEEAGRRLFALIAAGGTLGAIVGAQVVAQLGRWLGPMHLIFVAAGLLVVCLLLTRWARRLGEARAGPAAPPAKERPGDERGGFSLLLGDRYLLLIACSVVLLNLVNTTGDQIMAMIVHDEAAQLEGEAREHFLTAYYANFQTWVSVATAAVQVFAVARVLRLAGMQAALAVLPVIAMAGYGALAFAPSLMLVRPLKVVENGADYSLQNTLQQTLFLPTSRAAKYKAKAATDTFFVRFGDLASWLLVTFALAGAWSVTALALVNAAVAVGWLVVALLLARRYQHLAQKAREPAPRRAYRTRFTEVAQPAMELTPGGRSR